MAIKLQSDSERHDINQLRILQLALLCFSIIFLFILYNGWSSLFSHSGTLVATLGSAVLALLAWSLGRYIGSSEGGIPRNAPIFVLLLVLSAAGVFNWMMIHLEGKTIYQEAVTNAEDAFTNLEASARRNVGDTALAAKETDIKNKEQLFLREVRNPLNCGRGPVAQQRLRELVALLPDLRLPSPPRFRRALDSTTDCDTQADVYRDAIDQEWNATDDGKKLAAVRQTLADITAKIDQTLAELRALRQRSETEGVDFILGAGRDALQTANDTYKTQLGRVLAYAPDSNLPRNLDLTTALRLGEWSQIISVIVSRLDQVSTYVYMLLAVFMDFMLIYLFSEHRRMKLRQPKVLVTTAKGVSHLGDEAS